MGGFSLSPTSSPPSSSSPSSPSSFLIFLPFMGGFSSSFPSSPLPFLVLLTIVLFSTTTLPSSFPIFLECTLTSFSSLLVTFCITTDDPSIDSLRDSSSSACSLLSFFEPASLLLIFFDADFDNILISGSVSVLSVDIFFSSPECYINISNKLFCNNDTFSLAEIKEGV